MKYLKKIKSLSERYFVTDKPNLVLLDDTKEVLYNIDVGNVFIQHIDGRLFSVDEWTTKGLSGDVANGVAVIDSRASFVIAKEDLFGNKWSANTTSYIEGIVSTTSSAAAAEDYNGVSNTALMLETDNSGAGYSCANYSFPNGQTGYLAAAGEWRVAGDYNSDIDLAMQLIGTPLQIGSGHNGYWTSTQYSRDNAWTLEWNSNNSKIYLWDGYGKASYRPVRPFTTLEL